MGARVSVIMVQVLTVQVAGLEGQPFGIPLRYSSRLLSGSRPRFQIYMQGWKVPAFLERSVSLDLGRQWERFPNMSQLEERRERFPNLSQLNLSMTSWQHSARNDRKTGTKKLGHSRKKFNRLSDDGVCERVKDRRFPFPKVFV